MLPEEHQSHIAFPSFFTIASNRRQKMNTETHGAKQNIQSPRGFKAVKSKGNEISGYSGMWLLGRGQGGAWQMGAQRVGQEQLCRCQAAKPRDVFPAILIHCPSERTVRYGMGADLRSRIEPEGEQERRTACCHARVPFSPHLCPSFCTTHSFCSHVDPAVRH